MPLLRRLALLLAVEGVALVVLGVAYGIASLGDDSGRAPAELAAGFCVAAGALLLWLAVATDRGRTWTRAPGIVLNVFPFGPGISAVQAGAYAVAVPLLLLAGTALYLYATPELRQHFQRS